MQFFVELNTALQSFAMNDVEVFIAISYRPTYTIHMYIVHPR